MYSVPISKNINCVSIIMKHKLMLLKKFIAAYSKSCKKHINEANSSFVGDSVLCIVNIVLEKVIRGINVWLNMETKPVFCSIRQTAVLYLNVTLWYSTHWTSSIVPL
jgi:hypothetical protein